MDENEKPIRLLLVDDDIEFLEAITPGLTRRGFALTLAEDGRRALRLLARQPFDAVILDVKMPGIDGIEVFRRISRLAPELPVIMLTGHACVEDAFETSRDGVFDYLNKPCEIEKLASVARAAAASTTRAELPANDQRAEPVPEIRVLLVDDDPELLASLSAALRRRRLRVTTVSTPLMALWQIEQELFHVGLVDATMRGAGGTLLPKLLKQAQPMMEVLVTMGSPNAHDAVECLRAGAFSVLDKPQPVAALVKSIREAHRSHEVRYREAQQQQVEQIIEERPD